MTLNRSFFVPVNSSLHRLNPLTKLTFVFAMLVMAFISLPELAPVLAIPIFIIVFIGKVQRQYLNVLIKLVLPTILFMFIMQSLFLPDGETILFSIGIFEVSKETVISAFFSVSRIFVMVSSFTILLLTTHPSELMSDLTRRGLPPQLAYVILSTLQILPQMQAKAQTIIAAQRSRGLDTQGTFIKRVGALLPLAGPLVFGSLVEVEERAIAIEARGFTSSRPRTFLNEIIETGFDHMARLVLILVVISTLILKLWLS
jgi:energy-coupling factor transport system permease protein